MLYKLYFVVVMSAVFFTGLLDAYYMNLQL